MSYENNQDENIFAQNLYILLLSSWNREYESLTIV